MAPRRSFRFAVLSAAVALSGVCGAAGSEPLRASLSAPAAAPQGARIRVEALILNPNDAAAAFSYAARFAGLTVSGKPPSGRAWLAPRACLLIGWTGTVAAAKEASFALTLAGRAAGERRIRVAAAPKPAALSRVAFLSKTPLILPMPEPGKTYTVEVTVTLGAYGERAATADRLAAVSGLDTNAIVGRGLVPAVLSGGRTPDIGLLAALQTASGGWGLRPTGAPEVRTTSWVVFWLGQLGKADRERVARPLNRAAAYLRESLAGAPVEMRARVLPALAMSGRKTKRDAALVRKDDAGKLSPMGRLLAAYGGADVPLPPKEAWGGLDGREMSVLVCHLADRKRMTEARSLLPALMKRRGAEPRFDTHEAPLYALALAKAARPPEPGTAAVITATVDGRKIKEVRITGGRPVARLTLRVGGAAPPGRRSRLSLAAAGARGPLCRVVVRPAD